MSEAIKRRVEQAKLAMEEHSRSLEAQQLRWRDARQRDQMFFPSLHPTSRGPTSPLDGRSPDWRWSGRKS
jgi:hypothetical protein